MGFITSGPDAGRGLLDTASRARPDQPNRPPYNTPPAVPVGTLRTLGKYDAAPRGATLELALHHIVPWAVLRDFWNALVRAGWYDHLRDFAALFGRAKARTKYWPEDMANGKFADRLGGDFPTDLCWWEWNLVRGPRHRTSADTDRGVAGTDPGDAIDDLSRGNGRHAVHVAAMCEVGRAMERVILAAGTDRLGEIDPKALTETIRRWQALSRHPLIEFSPAVWRIENSSPDYAPSVNNRPPRHPRWNRRTRADG